MDWRGRRQSRNVEDRRGQPMRAGGGAGGVLLLLRFLPMMLRSKVGRIVLVLGVLVFFGARLLGIDLLQVGDGGAQTASRSAQEFTRKSRSWPNLSALFWRTPKIPGTLSSRPRGSATRSRAWCCSPTVWHRRTSEQRMTWFKRGFDSGDVGQCDSFSSRL